MKINNLEHHYMGIVLFIPSVGSLNPFNKISYNKNLLKLTKELESKAKSFDDSEYTKEFLYYELLTKEKINKII